MYIKKDRLENGVNSYASADSGAGMDVELLLLGAGERYELTESKKETAFLLFSGRALWSAGGREQQICREDMFKEGTWCLHISRGTPAVIEARSDCEIYIQKAVNPREFEPHFYTPEDVSTVEAGNHGELDGTMHRYIRTIFDYSNAPYSNMVLGEVQNLPGRWSSYPPHHHPQPEVYFFRFDKPQGFGAGFGNGEIYRTGHNQLLVIESGFHSQVCAPGYNMVYVWGIRHLDGDPWVKTRIDDEEHKWLLEESESLYK